MKVLLSFLLLIQACLYQPASASAENTVSPNTQRLTDLRGQLLVASQNLTDPRFYHAVIFMLGNNTEGAMGLVVNRSFGLVSLKTLFGDLGIQNADQKKVKLNYGGPMQQNLGFVLHSDEFEGSSTEQFPNGMALSTDPDVVRAVATGKGPAKALFISGYSGWTAGQLEQEINHGDWLIVPASSELLFTEFTDTIWEKAVKKAGISL